MRNSKLSFLTKSVCVTILILILFPSYGLSQKLESVDSLKHELLQAAKEIMTSANTCALITIDQEGNPRVRIMDPFLPDKDFTVWFGTNPKSRKVKQIKSNPKVTLYYIDNNESGYVTLHGSAQIVNTSLEKEKRWKEEWEDFYQNKTTDYCLIKVTPEWMEIISYPHDIHGDSISWIPPVVQFDSK